MLAQSRLDQDLTTDSHHRLRGLVLLAITLVLAALALLPGRAAAAETPWTCSAYGYLFQDPSTVPPGSIYQVDLASGAYTNYGTTADNVNAVGYNILDNYVYGYDQNAGELVRVSSDGSLTPLGLPAGVNAALAYNVGDVDSSGHYWMMDGNVNPAQWYEIDLAPGSPTYGEVIESGTAAVPAGVTNLSDWAFINGALYTVSTATSGPAALVKFDPATGQLSNLGPVAGVPGTDFYGAVYSDAAGDLFASNNTTGEIYRVNVSNVTGIAVSQGPTSGNNDGERCATAPIPTVTVTKTVAGRGASADQFTVGLSDSGGKALTSATTSGTGTSASTTNWPVSEGSTYTITDAMTTGSSTPLSQYVKSIRCTDASGNVVPTGGTGPNWTLLIGSATNYTCNVTNATSADLEVGKSASPATAVPGENETYTLTVQNKGPSPASEAKVTDPLPSELSFVSADPGCTFAGGTVTCAAGTLAAGASKSFKVVTKVAGSVTHRIKNTAKAESPTPDPNPKNNEETIETPIGPKADLQLIKTASTSSVGAGGQVMYTLVVNNNGPSDATGVTVSDDLPAGMSLASAKPSQGSCASGATVKCNLGTVAAGGSAQVLVTANVSSSAGGATKNKASVIGDQPDPNPKNNEDETTVKVLNPPPPQPVSEIKIVKKADHANVYPGQKLTYILTVSNGGPDTASNVSVTDTASLSLKVLSAKPSQGSCKVGRPLTCALGTLANGKQVTIEVVAKVKDTGTESNSASATSSSKDPNPKNNLDGVRTKVTPKLLLKKTSSARTVTAGHEVTYHLTVTNPMIIAAHSVKVCDSLPAGLAYLGSSPKGAVTNGKVCWTIKTLAGGGSKTITVLARALRGASGNLTNHATATAKGMKAAAAATAQSTVRVKPAPPVPTPVTG
jgi:uncharacterized repeat protein (TIGR01451 family)